VFVNIKKSTETETMDTHLILVYHLSVPVKLIFFLALRWQHQEVIEVTINKRYKSYNAHSSNLNAYLT